MMYLSVILCDNHQSRIPGPKKLTRNFFKYLKIKHDFVSYNVKDLSMLTMLFTKFKKKGGKYCNIVWPKKI